MNKIIKKKKINIAEDSIIYLTDNNVDIEINNKSNVTIYHLVNDESVDVNIELNCENSKLNYYYSIISYNKNTFNINVYHNYSNTVSNIYNHGVNVLNNSLIFNVNGYVYKDLNNVICNQDNQIFNIKDGKSLIKPNLYIDANDIEANHSAYIGSFNKELVFYMQSRGLSDKKINQLLIKKLLIPKDIDINKIETFLNILKEI